MKKFFLFVTFFVGCVSPSLGLAEGFNAAALAPTAIRVDKGEKDFWFRRCTNSPFSNRVRHCADTALIVSFDDFSHLQEILMSECSKFSNFLKSLDTSEQCRKNLKKELEEFSQAITPSTWYFTDQTYLGWALENRSELPLN